MAFFSVEMGMEQVGLIQPNMVAVTNGISAARRLFEVIDRVSQIDPKATSGTVLVPSQVRGAVSFRNVTFRYPTRPDQPVLQNFRCGLHRLV